MKNSSLSDLATLEAMDISALRKEWRRLTGEPEPPLRSQELLRRELATRLEAALHGPMDAKLARRLDLIAKQKNDRGRASSQTAPAIGSTLIREWDGVSYSVVVLKDGFLFRGQTYRSLTAIAARITGAHWSGPRFFGLDGGRRT